MKWWKDFFLTIKNSRERKYRLVSQHQRGKIEDFKYLFVTHSCEIRFLWLHPLQTEAGRRQTKCEGFSCEGKRCLLIISMSLSFWQTVKSHVTYLIMSQNQFHCQHFSSSFFCASVIHVVAEFFFFLVALWPQSIGLYKITCLFLLSSVRDLSYRLLHRLAV